MIVMIGAKRLQQTVEHSTAGQECNAISKNVKVFGQKVLNEIKSIYLSI